MRDSTGGKCRIMSPTEPTRAYHILICQWEYCLASFRVRRGSDMDLPAICPMCQNPARWRIAFPEELTKSDRRLLRGLRILAEE